MINTSLVDKILKQSDAVMQLRKLQQALKEEKKRRKSFWEWITPAIKAEFINGEIVVHSPARKRHWEANLLLSTILGTFVDAKNRGTVGSEKVMISLTRNDYEPDIVFFRKEKADKFTEDQVLFPAPDLVVEILSPSTATNDKTTKKEDYALHGIAEYWIIDPIKQHVNKHILPPASKEYFPAKVYQSLDILDSTILEGFNIPVQAIFDKAINLKTMQKIIEKTV